MIYFDSDVLINYLVIQDKDKYATAKELYEKATREGQFFISLLSLQETSFVLAKLKMPDKEITEKMEVFWTNAPVDYNLELFKRACVLAELVGYQNVNDCLHTAIAELHCDEFATFNRSDFKRIQNFTDLRINIL